MQRELIAIALTSFPEAPNRTSHTAEHGPLEGLWAAARAGLFLAPRGLHSPGEEGNSPVCGRNAHAARRPGLETADPDAATTSPRSRPGVTGESSAERQRELVSDQENSPSNREVSPSSRGSLAEDGASSHGDEVAAAPATESRDRAKTSAAVCRTGGGGGEGLRGQGGIWEGEGQPGRAARNLLRRLRWATVCKRAFCMTPALSAASCPSEPLRRNVCSKSPYKDDPRPYAL